jgi:hypothetical protein
MAQHDQVIDNGPGLAVRTDINAAIAALFSSSSGTVEPTVKVAGQLWYNTSTGRMQVRNAANTAWESLTKTMDGSIEVSGSNNWVAFWGTSPGVATELFGIQDNRVTTGAEGNSVFAIKRQGSSTPALMFGNDANHAGLIGANNTGLRIGKWVSGVFTEYMNLSTAGIFTVTGGFSFNAGAVKIGTGADAGYMELTGANPRIKLTDNTAGADDFWAYVDSNVFYILTDRDDSGAWETPHPFELQNASGLAYAYGFQVLTANDYDTNSTGNKLAMRDSSGDINARLFRSEYDSTNGSIGFIMTQVDTGTNNYIRPSTPSQVASALSGLVNAGTLDGIDSSGFAQVSTTSSSTATSFPVGHVLAVSTGGSRIRNDTLPVCVYNSNQYQYATSNVSGAGAQLAGTWRFRGQTDGDNGIYLMQRVA